MTTNFAEIIFDPTGHSYTYEGKPLVGTTRLLAQLKRPFDRTSWARREAEKLGITVEAFLTEQDADFKRRMQHGDDVHSWIAHELRSFQRHEADQNAGSLPEIFAFRHFWSSNKYEPYLVEWIIGDADLGLAGTTDAVIYNPDTGLHHLWDWKTGTKFRTENRFQNLLPPFASLNDCELVNYSLQLSLYRLIIERNTDLMLGDSHLLYLPAGGNCLVYTALDLRQPLLKWLEERALMLKATYEER